jgi:hypothetical protein
MVPTRGILALVNHASAEGNKAGGRWQTAVPPDPTPSCVLGKGTVPVPRKWDAGANCADSCRASCSL